MRILSKVMLPETQDGLRKSTAIYFFCSALITLIALGLYKWVLPNIPIIKYYKELSTSGSVGVAGIHAVASNRIQQ